MTNLLIYRWLLANAAIAASVFMASAATAQPVCGPRERVLEALATTYGETGMLALTRSSGDVFHLYANAATGTWTLLAFPAPHLACPLASGNAFIPLREQPKPKQGT